MNGPIELSCPTPRAEYPRVSLAHGGGGRMMQRLIQEVFATAFANEHLVTDHDGAWLPLAGPTALTTDAYTVQPLFFPGGDVGTLAVCGTVNDLAMCGARPRYLAAAFVLEEGLPMADLRRIVTSMADAAREAQVGIVTGDTKVVERGKGDGVFITTTGVGEPLHSNRPGPGRLREGDGLIVSGPVGDHGVAVMAAREQIRFSTQLQSDVAPVAATVAALYEAGIDVHCLRDPTRGGLATVVCDLASASGLGIRLLEETIPIDSAVADACELLGLDPLYVACEGRFVAVIPGGQVEACLQVLRNNGAPHARHVGQVVADHLGCAVLRSAIGGERALDLLSGEQLPRIC